MTFETLFPALRNLLGRLNRMIPTLLPALFALVPAAALFSQNTPKTIFELLTSSEGAQMTLEIDLTELVAQKKTNNYFGGKLTLKDGRTFSVEARPRGRYRRRLLDVPPLKLRFSKTELASLGLDTLDEIKLTLPHLNIPQGEDLVLREYLIYKLFEKTTPNSLHARLIKLTLVDTQQKKKMPKNVYAIFVEDEEELAVRLGGKPEIQYGIALSELEPMQAARVAVFEYMVGNTDWDWSMQRNVDMIRPKDNGKALIVPYDFDFSGLVAAPYSKPASGLGLRTTRDRYLLAEGMKAEAIQSAITEIKNLEKEYLAICKSKWIENEAREDITAYLRSFFDALRQRSDAPSPLFWEPKR